MAFNKTKALAAADKHIAKQNYNKALNELLKVAKVTPNDTNILNKIGDLYSKLGNKTNAVNYFEKVANAYQKSGFNLKAIAVYKKVIRTNPDYMEARDRLVDLFLQQGHHSEAKAELRQIGEHYYSENLFNRALEAYEKLLEIDPSNLDSRLKITEILVREGRRTEAATHFHAMGEELLEKNMVNEAQKMANQGLKMDPDSIKLQTLGAQIFLAEGKTDEALHALTEICRKNDRDQEAIRILGRTYFDRGQLREAKACFLRALHLNQDEIQPLEEVAQKFIDRGELDEAFSTLVPISERLLEKEAYDAAIALFRNILYTDENHKLSQEKLVEIYEKSGQTANAILGLEKMITYFLSEQKKPEAIEKIRDLLRLDPNNLEWRSQLDALGDGLFDPSQSASNTSLSGDDVTGIHMIEDTGFEPEIDETLTSPVKMGKINLEPDDESTVIANHMTEAEVFMKYGILDQAMTHLLEIKKIDQTHLEANTKLKHLYLERNQPEKVAICLVDMITGYIQREEYHRASDLLKELGEIDPNVAREQRARLGAFINKEQAEAMEISQSFGYDFKQNQPSSENLVFEEPSAMDVVDFSKMGGSPEAVADGFELPSQIDDGGWSLDLPKPAVGQAEDLADIFRHDATGNQKKDVDALDFPKTTDTPSDGDFSNVEEIQFDETPDHGSEPETPVAPQPKPVAKEPAKPVPIPDPTPAQSRSLISELEEIDFFISVEAYEDARNLLTETQKRFGEHPLIMERLQEIESYTGQSVAQKLPLGGDENMGEDLLDSDTGFFDLAAELSEELFDEGGDVYDKTGQEEIQSVEELFEEFKKGVSEQIDEGDYETHYDLGIAYKEMGLLEEGICEFEKARNDRDRYLECSTLIGACMIELGRTEDAIGHYEQSLEKAGLQQLEIVALKYELALAYQGLGELEKALNLFKEIQDIDQTYRDLEERIAALV